MNQDAGTDEEQQRREESEKAESDQLHLANKQIMILSSAGKPIFARLGDEQELNTTMGLVQAIISFSKDYGDEIRCIKAGCRRIVFLVQQSLYFVIIASTGEPEFFLKLQLQYLYQQIMFVLTSKVHKVFQTTPSYDLRELLGDVRALHRTCATDVLPLTHALQSVKCLPLDPEVRSNFTTALKNNCGTSGALYALVLCADQLVTLLQPKAAEHRMPVTDLLLIIDFINASQSLRTHEQNWFPMCLPNFNDKGFLQAYVACIHNSGDSHPWFLVLVSTSNESEQFYQFHSGRQALQEELARENFLERMDDAVRLGNSYASRYVTSVRCMHFAFKLSSKIVGCPPVLVQPAFMFPLADEENQKKLNVAYQRLSLRLRGGSSTSEATFPVTDTPICGPASSFNLSPPSVDHSFAYVAHDTEIFAAVASSNSELYVTFPSILEPIDTCALASYLSKVLRHEIETFGVITLQFL